MMDTLKVVLAVEAVVVIAIIVIVASLFERVF